MTPLHPTKMGRLLAIFTKNEFVQFRAWLQSPWANSNKKLTALYKLLQKNFPDFTAPELTKENLFQKLYPGKAYDDKSMRNLMAAMCKQAEKFLQHQRLEKDESLSTRLLAQEYFERHESDWYEKEVEGLVKRLESKKNKETIDYLHLAILHDDLYYRNDHLKWQKSHVSLQMADLCLDTFYSIQKWRYLTELNERQQVLAENYEIDDTLALLENLTHRLNIPVTEIYRERMKLTRTLTPETYLSFKEKVFIQFDHLSEQDKRLLLYYLINSAIQLWLKGHDQIMTEVLELYKKGLKEGLLIVHGRLSENTYLNIITTGNSLGQFSFVENFISEFTSCLAPDNRKDGKTWATAHSLFKQNQYEDCITLLSAHKFNVLVFSLNSKMLLIQTYFEACRKDRSFYLFYLDFSEAFKKYIQREKFLSKDRKAAYLTLIKFTSNLLKYVMEKKPTHEKLESFRANIHQERQIQGKQWLLGKIEELKQGLPQ